MHLTQHESLEWTEIDAAITRLAADKGALDLDIGRWLLVAHREGVERRLGFGSFAEYVERRLGYDARTTFERLRVARALEVLPTLASLLRRGERSWSAVRELTRVATPGNEAAWVEASERMTVRQVESMVAGREAGEMPWGARDRCSRRAGSYSSCRPTSWRSGKSAHVGVDHGASAHVGGDDAAQPGIAEALAPLARRSGVRALTRVLAQVIRAPTTVTPKLRAAVRTCDRGRCVVPGCTHFRFLDLHHQEPRAHGGRNTLTNLLSLCTRHHRLVHEGVLAIEGTPESGLVVRHAGGALYGAARAAGV